MKIRWTAVIGASALALTLGLSGCAGTPAQTSAAPPAGTAPQTPASETTPTAAETVVGIN